MKNSNYFFSNTIKTLTVLTILGLTSLSCSNEEYNDFDPTSKIITGLDVKNADFLADGLEPYTIDLLAGQHKLAGKVMVSSDNTNLLVTYKVNSGWTMTASHLYVGFCDQMPTTRKGNPKIGRFPYKEDHGTGVSEYSYSIPLDEINDCFCLAAHAVVGCGDEFIEPTEPNPTPPIVTVAPENVTTSKNAANDGDNNCSEETAWAKGTEFPGNSWAMYTEFCEEIPTTTDPGNGPA